MRRRNSYAVRGARDAAGRRGVAIAWSYGGQSQIILSLRTFAYLGDRTFPSPSFHAPDHSQYDGYALLKPATIVNRAGQLP